MKSQLSLETAALEDLQPLSKHLTEVLASAIDGWMVTCSAEIRA